MNAAVLHVLGEPLRLHNDVEPPPLGRGQVWVQLAFSGVCHSQLMEARGKRGPDPYVPHLLGHEGSGVVLSVGSDVTKVAAGDHVVLGWIKGRGIDAGGVKYRCADGVVNAGGVTTFNDHAVVSENRCVVIPEGVPMDVAALLGCAALTGAGMVMNDLAPKPGSTVAVFGLGGIGLSALMALSLCDCRMVIAVDVAQDKLRMARTLGATHVVNASQSDPVAAIRDLTDGGRGVDYSVEAAGRCDTIEQAFSAVRRSGGLCVFASHPPHDQRISLDPFELICGKQIRGSWGGSSDPDRDIPRLTRFYLDGRFPLQRLISRRYPLSAVNEALNDLERGVVARPLLEIDPGVGALS